MKFDAPKNPNYAATIVQVERIIPLENCDNVVAIPVLGYQAIVGKDTQVGDVLVVFTAETQLSTLYAGFNNLFRHSELNDDTTKTGYLEDNRRVKAMKFRGHRSDALAMPLISLAGMTSDWQSLEVGDTFDVLNGYDICNKYVRPGSDKGPSNQAAQVKKETRVDKMFLPEHFDTENYWRNSYKIAPHEHVVVTQKIHGTSIRFGRTVVKRRLTLRDKIAKFFGASVQETEIDLVAGSRKVIKDVNNPDQNHYYDTDLWSLYGKQFGAGLPDNVVVYGELIGWTPEGAPLQANYTYDVPKGRAHLYVYRVTIVTPSGHQFDLSWEALKEFTAQFGLNHVPELWQGAHAEFNPDDWTDIRYFDEIVGQGAIPLSDPKTVDEGVCVRREGLVPLVLKAKSPIFLGHETKMLDKDTVDIEAEESTDAS